MAPHMCGRRGLANLSVDPQCAYGLVETITLITSPLTSPADHVVRGHVLRALYNLSIHEPARLGMSIDR